MFDSLRPGGLQHTGSLCLSLSRRVCSNLGPLSQLYHPIISSSAMLFSYCLRSFLASGSFPMSWPLASCGQSTGASASTSVLPINIQDGFPLGLNGLISLLSKGVSWVFSSTTCANGNTKSMWSYLILYLVECFCKNLNYKNEERCS